jgi:hypothetical protein
VLRRAEGKALAYLHDAIVVPQSIGIDRKEDALIEPELARAVEFGKGALNPSSITELQLIAQRYSIDLTAYLDQGDEIDE